MAYIFSDLKTKLQTQIGDPNLDATVAGDAINYTEQAVFNSFPLTLNSASQTNSVTAGTNVLASSLPTNFQRLSSLRITAPAGSVNDITELYLSTKDFREQYPSTTNTGQLTYWTYWTGIEFSHNADQTYTLAIDYYKSVPFLSDSSDIPTIPQAFEEMLILGAKLRIYEQKEDFDYASQFQNRYADLLEAFTTRYSNRQVDNQVVIP